MPNPLQIPTTAASYGSGTLPGGTYYVEYTWYGNNYETLPSPEFQVLLTGTGQFTFAPPSGGIPANATGMKVYVGLAHGGEVAQSQTIGTASYTQSSPVVLGAGGPPSINDSVCSIAFNDTIIPYSGYNVSLTSSTGNAYPGWPQAWQLNGGLSGTVNVSQGAPLWNGVVIYPAPVLQQPLNHGPQSISGSLNMTGYPIVNLSMLGVGTATPTYPIDVENGLINTNLGFAIGGTAPNGHFLCGNGTAYVDSSVLCNNGGSSGQPYYFQDDSNSIPLPRRGVNNFLPPLVCVDNASGNATNCSLQSSVVTPGTYTNPTTTVDTYGRVTGISNGVALPLIQSLIITSGICSTGTTGTAPFYCSFTVNWPNPTLFPDNSYAVACSPNSAGIGGLTALMFSNKTATGFELTIQSGTANMGTNVTLTEIDCVGMHN